MKATLALVAALLGLAAAGASSPSIGRDTHAYIFRSDSVQYDRDWTPVPVPASVARAVIHQRLSRDPRTAVTLQDLLAAVPSDDEIDAEAMIMMLNTFGKPTTALFGDGPTDTPAQLVVMVEGVTEQAAEPLSEAFGRQSLAFTVPGTVDGKEINRLVEEELVPLGVRSSSECLLYDNGCRDADSVIVRYNVEKGPEALHNILEDVPRHRHLATMGIRETIFFFFPDTTKATAKALSNAKVPLRRRQTAAESVMTESDASPSSASASSPKVQFIEDDDNENTSPAISLAAPTGPIPACFDTEDACKSSTGNCSSHGQCRNQWGPEVQGGACWACHCLMNQDGTQWGGRVCQKIDISAPFWLIVGTSLALVGAVGTVVGMLFSVGEERLPGVIGAGVSRK